MNTAWTIQIIKGIIIAIALVAISGMAGQHYNQPELQSLLIIISISSIISGLGSTKPILAQRNLTHAKRQFGIALGTQCAGVIVTSGLAYINPTAESLAWGNLLSACLTVTFSHWLYPGPKNSLLFHRDSARHILEFGGIVMLSSGFTFLAGEGSKLLSASFISIGLIGLMGLAGNISSIANQVFSAVASKALFPAISELNRSSDQERLKRAIDRSKIALVFPCWIFSLSLLMEGPTIVEWLYDERYKDAGLILQIMGMGGMANILTSSYSGILSAIGRPALNLYILFAKTIFSWGAMLIGYRLFGGIGVISGPIIGAFLLYPIVAIIFHRIGLWSARIDIPILIISILTCIWMVPRMDWSASSAW